MSHVYCGKSDGLDLMAANDHSLVVFSEAVCVLCRDTPDGLGAGDSHHYSQLGFVSGSKNFRER